MTREEALKEADATIESLLKSGDKTLFDAATINGILDSSLLVAAALRARDRLADKIIEDWKSSKMQ